VRVVVRAVVRASGSEGEGWAMRPPMEVVRRARKVWRLVMGVVRGRGAAVMGVRGVRKLWVEWISSLPARR
jgi:hypothetical protein